jgi:POT family proton-dependent oligopeptide transporter
MWERFSYHGMRAFLFLYIAAPTAAGGLGFSAADAASVYGSYTGAAWASALLGGFIADRWLGHAQSVLLGAMLIAAGHFTLTIGVDYTFYGGLSLLVIGTGLLKPNVSTLVGSLYDGADPRRDAAFSIFYMGINVGGFLGPLLIGYAAQRINWHLGFAIAGLGMLVGLIQFTVGRKQFAPASLHMAEKVHEQAPGVSHRLTAQERKRVDAIVVLLVFAAVFWAAYEQIGSTLNMFADRFVQLSVLGMSFPSTWFQAAPSLMVIVLAPVFAWLWTRLGNRGPSSATKFGCGLFFAGLAFLLLVPAAMLAQGGGNRVSAWWLTGFYLILEFGELCLSPVGLSLVTRLAPARLAGIMMGAWFLASAIGSKLAGYAASFSETTPLATLFSWISGICIIAALIMFALVKFLRGTRSDSLS